MSKRIAKYGGKYHLVFYDQSENWIQKEFTILSMSDKTYFVQCNTCKATFHYSKENMRLFKHGGLYCQMYLHKKISNEYGEKVYKSFKSKYAGSRTRCLNPNNKDYDNYKNLEYGFNNFFEFYDNLFDIFIQAINKYNIIDNLSIDRIDGSKGYISGNIRFVPMELNLKNKSNIKKVKCIPLVNNPTNTFRIYQNCHECGLKTGVDPARIYDCCNRENHRYCDIYEFYYLDE